MNDTEASLRSIETCWAFASLARATNYGPEQERLNSVFGARLRITGLRAASGPGIEFLEYLAPRNGRPATGIQRQRPGPLGDHVHDRRCAARHSSSSCSQQVMFVSPGVSALQADAANSTQASWCRIPMAMPVKVIAAMTAEETRLDERSARPPAHWKRWGPYLSERAWGTVREDYSADGTAWEYFPHDHARHAPTAGTRTASPASATAIRQICFALALWNGRDPILKERLFGLTGNEGNHGEDVKEYYFYLDSTPTHSYMKYLYKYPQRAFPYGQLVEENRRRGKHEPEYELLDTGVFDDNRYFDVFVEYAKASPKTSWCASRVANRGPSRAPLHLLPTIWFRNTWSWGNERAAPVAAKAESAATRTDRARSPADRRTLAVLRGRAELLFTENETNIAAAVRRRRTRSPSSRTASTTTSFTATATR